MCEIIAAGGLPMSGRSEPAVGRPRTIGLDAGGSAANAAPVAVRKAATSEYEEGAHGTV